MLEELPANYAKAISIISVVVWGTGSLLYLLKRPRLTGDQKLVALVIGLAAGVPTDGLLAIIIMAAIFLPACSSGCHITNDSSYWMISPRCRLQRASPSWWRPASPTKGRKRPKKRETGNSVALATAVVQAPCFTAFSVLGNAGTFASLRFSGVRHDSFGVLDIVVLAVDAGAVLTLWGILRAMEPPVTCFMVRLDLRGGLS